MFDFSHQVQGLLCKTWTTIETVLVDSNDQKSRSGGRTLDLVKTVASLGTCGTIEQVPRVLGQQVPPHQAHSAQSSLQALMQADSSKEAQSSQQVPGWGPTDHHQHSTPANSWKGHSRAAGIQD